ncbi:MAG TPA: NYN domain-containing protein [Candidatus Paceibacterota bacterium]
MSIIKHQGQRVGMFIDTQNLYHCAKNLYGARVNFGAILKEVVADRTLVRAIAYVITTESGEEKNFLDALGKVGIEIKTKDLQIFVGGAKKADWDVGLAIDAVKLAPRLDAVIILSGDGDFVPLVEYLKIHSGNQVEVAAFGKSTSAKLKEVADDFLDLGLNPRRYLLGFNHQRQSRRAPRSAAAPITGLNNHDNNSAPAA